MTTRRRLWLALAGAGAALRGRSAAAQTEDGSLELPPNARLVVTADNPVGTISRLVQFRATTPFDRPWAAWLDHLGRLRAALGYHTLTAAGTPHEAWELKTSADPNGAQSGAMLTRIQVGTDADRTGFTLGYLTALGLQAGTSDLDKSVDVTVRFQTAAGGNPLLSRIRTTRTGADGVRMEVDLWPADADAGAELGTGDVLLRLFRNTRTTGARRFAILKGDGTNTETFGVDAATGALALANGATIRGGPGSPQGVVAAKPGSTYHGSDGIVWRKATGTGTDGWMTP